MKALCVQVGSRGTGANPQASIKRSLFRRQRFLCDCALLVRLWSFDRNEIMWKFHQLSLQSLASRSCGDFPGIGIAPAAECKEVRTSASEKSQLSIFRAHFLLDLQLIILICTISIISLWQGQPEEEFCAVMGSIFVRLPAPPLPSSWWIRLESSCKSHKNGEPRYEAGKFYSAKAGCCFQWFKSCRVISNSTRNPFTLRLLWFYQRLLRLLNVASYCQPFLASWVKYVW